jgi:hypothetical protein
MKMPRARRSDGDVLPLSDQECLALLRQAIEETRTTIAQSRVVIRSSLDAITLLVRLQGPQISN